MAADKENLEEAQDFWREVEACETRQALAGLAFMGSGFVGVASEVAANSPDIPINGGTAIGALFVIGGLELARSRFAAATRAQRAADTHETQLYDQEEDF